MNAEDVAVELTNHNDRLKAVEKGVSNFHKFQLSTTRKIGFVYGATWVGGILGMILLTILTWALSLILPAAKVVVDEYYRNHPTAVLQKDAQIAPLVSLYADRQKALQIALWIFDCPNYENSGKIATTSGILPRSYCRPKLEKVIWRKP